MTLRSIRQTGFFRAAARASLAPLALALCAPASVAQSATAANVPPSAYTIAIKCFVVAGLAKRNSDKAHDQAKADYYDEKSESDFNVALGLGKVLGYSQERMDADINAIMKRELPLLMNANYFQQATAECRAYQLI